MYSGRQKTVNLPPLQLIALLFGVGLFVLLLVLAGKSAFERARDSTSGLARGLTHGADREMRGDGGNASGGAQGLAHRSGAPNGQRGQPSATAQTQTAPFVPPIVSTVGGPQAVFVTDAQREAAQESLAPLHELLDTVRRFDTTVLGAASDGTAGQTQNGGAAKPFNVPLLLDNLEAQTDRVAHPYYFPMPLQDDAAQATREVYTYLETVRAGGIGQTKLPDGDAALIRTKAQKHLEQGALLVARMDALAQGGGSDDTAGLSATLVSAPPSGHTSLLP